MTRQTIGAAVASRSEGPLLRKCLEAARGLDELVLIDLDSDDDTAEIGAAYGADVLRHPAVPFVELIRADQLRRATTDWVLFLDPDEVLPPGWIEAARAMVTNAPADVAGFLIPYQDIAFGRRLNHARRGAEKLSLVRRNRARPPAADLVRPHMVLGLEGAVVSASGVLQPIQHHSYRTVAESIDKLSRYAKAGGVGAETAGGALTALTAIKMLWGTVVMSRSWRDGPEGIAVASMSAIGDYLGLLQRWDESGRPEAKLSRRHIASLEAGRWLHGLQWRLRRAVSGKIRSMAGDE